VSESQLGALVAGTAVQGRSIMPPYLVLRHFLDEATVAGLLDYAISRQADFAPMLLGSKSVNTSIRVSVGLRDLRSYRQTIETKIRRLVPALIAQLQVTPFEPGAFELELVAHGEGAFYKRHIDTQTARYNDVQKIRVLSCVYYFHAEPKPFSGGALRLYAVVGDSGYVDAAPERNTLLVFPSWAPHEVMPIVCPSRRFADSRFAINCWVYRAKPRSAVLTAAGRESPP
jgi:SM-20-related protein